MAAKHIDTIRDVLLFEVDIAGVTYRRYGSYYLRRPLTTPKHHLGRNDYYLLVGPEHEGLKDQIDEQIDQWIEANLPADTPALI